MRKAGVVRKPAPEDKHVRDATDAAHNALWDALRWLHAEGKKPEAARHKYATDLITRILTSAEGARLLRKYQPDPNVRDRVLQTHQEDRAPSGPKAGPRAQTVRDRLLAEIIENIRCVGFHPTRNAVSDYPSACSIVAAAWRKLEKGEAPPARLKQGFSPFPADVTKALSEKGLEGIWGRSIWAGKYRKR